MLMGKGGGENLDLGVLSQRDRVAAILTGTRDGSWRKEEPVDQAIRDCSKRHGMGFGGSGSTLIAAERTARSAG
jgi:hypothetical protein